MARLRKLCWAVLVTISLSCSSYASASEPGLTIELNRLDTRGEGCRVHVVVTNKGQVTYTGFALDLVIFDQQQRIAKRTGLDVAPVRSAKTTVYAFDVADLACDAMGSVLLNDVVDCASAAGEISDCVDRVSTASKTAIPLRK